MIYTTIRTNRRTLALQIKGREVVVRAPVSVSDAQIEKFVLDHADWIEKHIRESCENERKYDDIIPLSKDDIRRLSDMAVKLIPERVRYYAPLVGVSYGRITIRNQRSRWGSCSSKGNLNFNCLLMLAPPEVIDSVVVHELCHRKEMNHSARFYEEVLRVFPEYHKWNKWLKENGEALMRRNF